VKRTNGLFERICNRDNLALAFWKAARGRRQRAEIRKFSVDLDLRLSEIRDQLRDNSYTFGKYHQFTICDPKRRVITAPDFSERVVHHAIMNVCEPFFERKYIDQTYACRVGKGRNVCLAQAVACSRKFSHVVHLDIKSYFDSVSHHMMLEQLSRVFKDLRLLEIFQKILTSYHTRRGYGIPIGTLCSQHFANLYLSRLDRFLKEDQQLPGYVRYMDDFVLWSDDRQRLNHLVEQIGQWLSDNLELKLKSTCRAHGAKRGFNFLGHRIFPGWMTLNRRSYRRYRSRLLEVTTAFAAGSIDASQLQSQATALTSFVLGRGVSSWKFCALAIQWVARWVARSVEDR
jgi:RNA-directed DNA polymerase